MHSSMLYDDIKKYREPNKIASESIASGDYVDAMIINGLTESSDFEIFNYFERLKYSSAMEAVSKYLSSNKNSVFRQGR